MECKACGHKHDHWDGESTERTHKDTKPFKRIKGAFFVEGEWAWEGPEEVKLVICPECGTVRAENL